MKYNGSVDENGKLHIIHQDNFKLDLKSEIARPGQKTPVTIEVKKRRSIRTLSQNAYYWGVIVLMVRDRLRELTGEKYLGKEQAHEFLMLEVHYKEIVNEETGIILKIRKDTHDLTKSEFGDLTNTIIDWCDMWMDIKIPPPDTQSELNYELKESNE